MRYINRLFTYLLFLLSNVGENDDDFVLSSDDEAGDLGSDEETPGDSK